MSAAILESKRPARLVLADGTTFEGYGAGSEQSRVGEAVFTTGMTGYQEVLTDPSYCAQIVTMTSPHIGNVGTTQEDQETETTFVAGFVVHELGRRTSNWRSERSLSQYLADLRITALAGIDTRKLTRHLRDHGSQMAALGSEDRATLHDRALAAPPMTGRNLVSEVSCKEVQSWTEKSGVWQALSFGLPTSNEPRVADGDEPHIVAVDLGVKRNILRCLRDSGAKVTLVPADTSAKDILALSPDGIFLSNGPGDPEAVTGSVSCVKELLGKRPIFGICLGHQILSLALGASAHKLKFGHRGLNQPVQDLVTKRVEITTQNHGFVVDPESLTAGAQVTHRHLNDGSCEGVEHRESTAFGVQYHPEASAGPHDSRYLFGRFLSRVREFRA